jgi:excisionase family DNA binding protein
MLEIHIDGLEDLLRRVVREELAAQADGWLGSREAAKYLGISVGRLHNLVSSGDLPRRGEKGTGLRFRRADLDTYAEGRR